MRIQDKRENNSILLDEHGILCREYLPYENEYDPKQLKIINSGMFLTKDNWENVDAAIGEFTYTDPETGEEKTVYGVLAQALLAPLVLTSQVGVFNEDGTVKLDKNGLKIVYTGNGENDTVFKIQKKVVEEVEKTVTDPETGETTTSTEEVVRYVDVIYFDANGNAQYAGALSAATGTFAGALSAATGTFAGALSAATGTFVGTLSASCLQGGTFTVGGNGDENGVIRMLNANGVQLGSWNNENLSIGTSDDRVQLFGSAIYNGSPISTPFYAKQTFGTNVMEMFLTEANLFMTSGQRGVQISPDSLDICWNAGAGFQPQVSLYSSFLSAMADEFIISVTNLGGTLYLQASNTVANGNFSCTGTKNRVVETEQYSRRLLYSYETTTPLFGDIGEGEIGEDGKCYIWLDPIFAATISTSQYQVFLQKYGSGECYVSERNSNYFVVDGDPGLAFGWEIKAKQKDFDQRRLDEAGAEYYPPTTDYGVSAAKHIEKIRKERELV